MKKTIAIIISAMLICSLAACSSNNTSGTSSASSQISISKESAASIADSSESSTSNNFSVPGSDNSLQTSNNKNSSKTETGSQNSQSTQNSKSEQSSESDTSSGSDSGSKVTVTSAANSKIDTSDIFSERDLRQSADLSDAKTIQASDNKTETITEEGIYVITGSAGNFTVKVEADSEAKVQLVLDSLTVTNDNFPVIYVVSADKCFVTTTDSTNTLTVTGTFKSDGDTNTDAVIFSKDDLVLNGTGTLVISSSGNGISCKDDIKITGGTYNITSVKDSIEANDSISVYDGSFEINSSKDAFHSEDDDDDTTGWIYIKDGTFDLKAASDGIQAATYAQIDGGTLNITSSEGIESTYIQINGGTININASDDGINASQKSRSIGTPTVEVTGGSLTITMSGNDVDCIDSNGNIIVSGGTVSVNYPTQGSSESFDCDGTATYTGGTIIINGTQADSIPQSMMGGRGGMGGMGGRFGGMAQF